MQGYVCKSIAADSEERIPVRISTSVI